MKTPMTEVKSSGADPPAAMKVAPATSSLIPHLVKTLVGRVPFVFKIPFNDDVEGGHEVVVADEGEGVEHVEDADGVQHDGAVLPLLLREQVRREEGVVPAAVSLGGKLDAAEKEERE